MTEHNLTRTRGLALLLAAVVALSATAGFAGAATTTDLTVSITDDDNTLEPGESTTVEIAVSNVDGGVGAAEFGVELSDPGVANITDVSVPNSPGSTDNSVADGNQSADVKYAFADTTDTGNVTIVEVTLQASAAGSTDINVVENSDTGNLVVFDEQGAGYTLDTVGSATLTVEEANVAPTADAGEDQTVQSGETVTLDGTGSFDPNPTDTVSYSWTETTGSGVSLSDADTATPTFTAPEVGAETTLAFELTVTDDDGASDSDTVNVTVQPPDPANFAVSNLQAPGSAQQGETINVSADVENTGGQAATKAVDFRVDTDGDGEITDESAVASQDVQLDPGASTTVDFTDVDTSGLPVDTLTHGVATPDDSATAEIEITAPPTKQTTVSLQPAEQTIGVGASTTYEVVVDDALGGVGAGELRVAVNDTGVATITDAAVVGDGSADDIEIASDGSFVDVEYAFSDTADTGPVPIVEVTVEGAGAGTAGLAIGPAAGNSDVLVFDEDGFNYDVTGTDGATLKVVPVEFLVDDLSAPEKAAVGSNVTVTANVTNDGSIQTTQPVQFKLDLDADGDLETVASDPTTIDSGETVEVSFEVTVPAEASLGVQDHGVFTAADNATAQIEFTPPKLDEQQGLPDDPDDDGLYEDTNGDGELNTGDAQSLYSNRDDPAVQNYVAQYDFNDNGVVKVGDAQALYAIVTENV